MKNFVSRDSFRFKGEIPLEVKQGMGLTRDFSTSGLYFFTDQPVSMGETLVLVMLLDHQNQGQRVRLRCQADVVRIEPDPGKWVNDPPKAELSCPESVNEGAPVTLDGSGSADSDDGVASYGWSQILGTPNATLPSYDEATAKSVEFAAPYLTSANDTMTFKLLVTDNGALTDSKQCAVKVLDITPPVTSRAA